MDAALHERAEAAQALRTGITGRFLKLKIDDLALNARIVRDGDGLEVQVAAGQNDPAKVEEFQHRRRNSEPGAQIQLWYPHRFNDHFLMVGHLKIAYLYAFAKFGYGYILGPCLESVRSQIREPEKKTIWKWWLGRGGDLSPTMLYLIAQPFSCLAVTMNEHVIVLQASENCDHYHNIEQLTKDTPPDKLLGEFHSTHVFAAPTTMELLLDQGPS